MVHSSFLLIFGTQDSVLQISWFTAENSVFALFALGTVPTRKGNNKIPLMSQVLGYSGNSCCPFSYSFCHMGKVLLKALLEISHETERPVSQRNQVQIKRLFVTELFSARWKTVSDRQVSAEAGGELSISAPALCLKDKQRFLAMILSTVQN